MSLSKPKVLIIIANLGTPDAPTAPAVRAFLKQFLSDQRVIEIPKILWAIILNAFVLPFRPRRVAEAYAQVWSNDSPMREILFEQVESLQKKLISTNADLDLEIEKELLESPNESSSSVAKRIRIISMIPLIILLILALLFFERRF